MRVAFVRLKEAFARISDAAKLEGRPMPVIATDFRTARLLLTMIDEDIGACVRGMRPADWPSNQVGEFEGIKIIIASREETCKHEVDGWREHFGPLADIWS